LHSRDKEKSQGTLKHSYYCLNPQDSDKMNELIAKADDAMYAAKAQGGNMVSVFSEESSDIQSESI